MQVPVNAIEYIDGEIVYDLSCTEANDDWIRAARLLKAGKMKEFDKMNNTPMYKEV